MIITGLMNLFMNFFVGIFNLLSIPTTPQFLVNIKAMVIGGIQNYGMPICNFLFPHNTIALIINLYISLFNFYIIYKVVIWLYGKIRGSKTE